MKAAESRFILRGVVVQQPARYMSLEAADDVIAKITQCTRLSLNQTQRRRLAWIIACKGVPATWTKGSNLPDRTECVIVLDAPTNIEGDRLQGALTADAIVVIPCSEDPLFDVLKAELVNFGTVGALGSTGPHQLWWGGRTHSDTGHEQASAGDMPLIVSCYSSTLADTSNAVRLKSSVDALGLSLAISQNDAISCWETSAAAKVIHICSIWNATDRPVLWVEPDAVLHGHPSPPNATGCDFAVHRRKDHTFDASTIYFGRSNAADTLLQTWRDFCFSCPGTSDSYLLDQAWSVVSSQIDIDTIWLPRSYCATRSTLAPGEQPLVLRDGKARRFETIHGEAHSPLEIRPSSVAGRGYGRTGAPEAQLIMRSAAGTHGPVIVLIRDASPAWPTPFADVVEDIAAAFAHDAGGFTHMEVILCRSAADFQASVEVAEDAWLVVTTPHQQFDNTAFRIFGEAIESGSIKTTQSIRPKCSVRERSSVASAAPFKNVKPSETFLTRASAVRKSVYAAAGSRSKSTQH